MKTSSGDRAELISGIGNDAKQEAARIIEDAKKTVSDKQMSKEMQINSIKKDTDKKIDQQLAFIEKNKLSAISVERKRIELKVREKIVSNVTNKIKEKIAEKAEGSSYPEMLKGWILEAAIGLGEEDAVVNGSPKELEIMTESFLRETEKKYSALTGRNVSLKKAEKNPLFAQGIVLSSKDNRTAFNNQVPTRLMRYQPEIMKMIYKEFFA
ncbi:MAG: V-type proton ATPase subunit E [Spirochaetaceae bacterium]|nr:V-type proton ATPase subunit E [Spirochaetaceae bacterium]